MADNSSSGGARGIRGELAKVDAASYIRGLLIGSEIADARALFPAHGNSEVPLIGNTGLTALYATALDELGIASRIVPFQDACLSEFAALARVAA